MMASKCFVALTHPTQRWVDAIDKEVRKRSLLVWQDTEPVPILRDKRNRIVGMVSFGKGLVGKEHSPSIRHTKNVCISQKNDWVHWVAGRLFLTRKAFAVT
ncbi:hypothetical protein [Brevibacillus centrosporus]|uniref:hypothetical protein n=1 Tax=Brevibacillus centrosporus TaxID=54910 RepID=UPI0039888C55